MMTNLAYLRVSTTRQDVENQKLSVLDYANAKKLTPLTFIEESASGKLSWRERALGLWLLNDAKTGDNLVVSEVSRLGRSTLQVLEILEQAAKSKVSVHIAKTALVMDGSMQATITATILGLAAQIEREFISSRTKEALAQRKSLGVKLGRPKGNAEFLKLDAFRDDIDRYLKLGISKRSIARLIECAPSTLYRWLGRRRKSP